MAPKNITQEKRKDLRVGFSKGLNVKFSIAKKNFFFPLGKKISLVDNMSVGGIRMELPILKRKDLERVMDGRDKLFLELNLPSLKKPLRISGKLVWVKRKDHRGKTIYVVGVSFEQLKPQEKEEILRQLIGICLKDGCEIV